MKPIPKGYLTRHELEVTPSMTVDFEQSQPGLGKLHDVYATYWLGRHFELVSRKLTLPFLEDGEEGIGFELAVRHLAPTLPGMKVELEARSGGQQGNRLYATCRAWNELGDLIGEGSTTQVILNASELERRMARLRQRADGRET